MHRIVAASLTLAMFAVASVGIAVDSATQTAYASAGGADEQTFTPYTVTVRDAWGYVGSNGAEFYPQARVPSGTTELRAQAFWTEDPDDLFEGLGLWVRTAASQEPTFVGRIDADEVRFEVEEAQTDSPLQGKSAWAFLLQPLGDAARFTQDVRLVISADVTQAPSERPLAPPSPTLVAQAAGEIMEYRIHADLPGDADARYTGMTQDILLAPGARIGPETQQIVVKVRLDSNPAMDALVLAYQDADSYGLRYVHATASQGGVTTFVITPAASDLDSPDIQTGLWRFRLLAEETTGISQGIEASSGFAHGQFELTATIA